jgi:hypothetical protein
VRVSCSRKKVRQEQVSKGYVFDLRRRRKCQVTEIRTSFILLNTSGKFSSFSTLNEVTTLPRAAMSRASMASCRLLKEQSRHEARKRSGQD